MDALQAGQVIYVDFDDTLFTRDTGTPNAPLIEALQAARRRGILVHLWTHADFAETINRVEIMRGYGLVFDDVHCGVKKGDLIIDNLAISP